MKLVLGALAAASLLAGVAATQPASAQERCWWNGDGWSCRTPHYWGWHRHHPYWGHGYWGHRDWGWHRGWRY